MDLADILKYIPPTNIALLLVIFWLFRCIEKKDKLLQELGNLIHRNTDVTNNLASLVSILIQGRRV